MLMVIVAEGESVLEDVAGADRCSDLEGTHTTAIHSSVAGTSGFTQPWGQRHSPQVLARGAELGIFDNSSEVYPRHRQNPSLLSSLPPSLLL